MADSFDEKDVEILKMLRKDSRKPMNIIGDELGISKATVSRRVARMEESKTIKQYSLDIDHSSMGIMRSMIMMQVVGTPTNVIIEQIKEIEEIGHVYKTFGDHNLICEAFTHSVDELYKMIQAKLLKNPSIRNVEVDIILDASELNENADLELFGKDL